MMRILVSTPGISYDWVRDNEVIKSGFVNDVHEFDTTGEGFGMFTELTHDGVPERMIGINVPNFPLHVNKARGVAGPGKPSEELFVGPGIEGLSRMASTYDKWRPYPAENPSSYAWKMARKFSKKRCKMFDYAVDELSWDVIVFVDHSPASIAHLNKDEAMAIAEEVFSSAIAAGRSWPSAHLVLFSPYGVNGQNGFAVSSLVESSEVSSWSGIRRVFNGTEASEKET